MSRFDTLFSTSSSLAFLPFFVLGYPTNQYCLNAIDAAIEAGADALELGIPFSDPIADGPIIQQASDAVLQRDFSTKDAFNIIAQIRIKHPDIPIGLLAYAQSIEHYQVKDFFHDANQAGVDGVLIADVPVYESQPYKQIAQACDVDLIYLAAPSGNQETLEDIAKLGASYTYVVTRSGVTGIDKSFTLDNLQTQIAVLKSLNGPPSVLGFGIHTFEDVERIKRSGAAGFIVGSKIVSIMQGMSEADFEACLELKTFIQKLKG
jgi:tryptophan synthase alpha chain